MKTLNLRNILACLAAVILVTVAGAQGANAQVTVNWMNWTAPASYPTSYTAPNGTFTYANGTTGTLTLPNGTVVNVSMTGEIIDTSCFSELISGCNSYFRSVGGWAGYPTGTYTSNNVPSIPPNNNQVAQTGYADPAHVLTFSSPVQNVVMNVYSLGGATTSAYQFNQDFEILSQDPRCSASNPRGDYCLWKDGNTLYGFEGAGTVQFKGTYTTLSWSVTVPEYFSGFNIGVTSAGFDPACDTLNALTLEEVQWHSNAKVSPLTDAWYTEKFPSGFKIGIADRSVSLTSARAIRNFSPQGGVPAVLLSAWVDPTKKLKNDLAGSQMAAKLNLALSPQLTLAQLQAVKGMPAQFVGKTFKEMVKLGDEALGWNGTPATPPTQTYLNELNRALIMVNNSFPSNKNTGILACSVQ